jgi:hypothetical protein
MDCCTRAHRPELTPAFFGQVFKIGLGVETININIFLKGLCAAKRTERLWTSFSTECLS